MIMIDHRKEPSLGVFFLTWGLILSVCVLPARSEDLPPNVMAHDLGEPGSGLSIRLVQVPYYAGEELVLEATVRNMETRPVTLLEPRGLCVRVGPAPDFVDPRFGGINRVMDGCRSEEINFRAYVQYLRTYDVLLPMWVKRLQALSVNFAPGEARTATWVSRTFGHYRLELEGQSPRVFGLRVTSHDLKMDRWLRFGVHRFRDPIRGQLLKHPVHKYRSFFFTVPAGPGRFVVLSHGSWYPHEGPYETFDAATLNRAVERWSASQRAIVSHPDPALAYDADGTLLVDGQRAIVPRYRFQHGDHTAGGWALPPGSPPGEHDSDRTPVRDPFAGP